MPRKFRRVYEKLDIAKKYVTSFFQGSRYEEFFGDIEKYCMFIGYPRSGHSLVGSLLDAHKNMIIAHELDALKYLESGFSRNQLYHLIFENSKNFNEMDRKWTGYSYWVPNQWHGRFSELKIIGDKKGSRSVLRFIRNPGILQKLRDEIDVEIKFIHVTRNPFDNISRMFLKSRAKKKITLNEVIESYFSRAEAIHDMKQEIADEDILEITQESLIDAPEATLRDICTFLELEAAEDYLEDCASIIFKSPKKSRLETEWDPASIKVIEEKIEAYPFFRGYSFEE